MNGLVILLLIGVGFINLLLGLFALSRNFKSLSNIFFAMTTFALGGWVLGIAGFLSANGETAALIWAKAYYFFPQMVAVSILLFAAVFMRKERVPRKLYVLLAIAFLLVIVPLLAIPDYLTSSIAYRSWGKEVVLNKVHYLIYSAFLLSCLLGAEILMLRKSFKLGGVYRVQASLFFYGFLATGIFGVFFNLILPWFGNYRLIWLGPLFTTAFAAAISYSIIYHKMFDLRLAAVRSAAYILTFGLITFLYGLVVFGLGDIVLTEQNQITEVQRGFYIATAILTGLVFQPLKHFFDRLTNRLFFRDAYDSQEILDKISGIIVGNVDMGHLQRATLTLLSDVLRPSYAAFLLLSPQDSLYLSGRAGQAWQPKDLHGLKGWLANVGRKTKLYDELQDESESSLREALNKEDISVIVPLIIEKDTIGYLVMGPRLGGNIYNYQDTKLLNIAAGELAVALQNTQRYKEIQEFNITLQDEVNDATKQLRHTNEKLKALDETKDEFISMASHQLRTPLTSVKGYVSMVLEGDAGELNEQQRKLLTQAFISSQRMVYLIADLLNVSRLRTGKFIIEPAETYLPDVIDGELEQLKETAAAKGLSLSFDKPADFPKLMLDETKTRQVIMNFIDNAIYYTPSGGKIRIELEATAKTIDFRVVDTGLGVPKTEQRHLFTKFYRAENARKARPDGTGLGLFMAKKVVIAQGGAIIFKSMEGKGSTFGFTFPRHKIEVK